MAGKILVVGSLNMDLNVNTTRHPEIGETILGGKFSTLPGGKGANQAVAAARMGAEVTLIGRVGRDGFGDELRAAAFKDGINTTYIAVDEQEATGIALITVDAEGRNTIVVASGANLNLTPDHLLSMEDAFAAADVFVTQLESPLETVSAAIKLAVKHNLTVILNPAPAQPLSAELLSSVDYLIPNEIEAMQIAGESSLEAAVDKLLQMGVRNLVITLGERGVLVASASGQKRLPAYPVQVVDTVAAGDAFVGAFATGLAQNMIVEDAVQLGIAAAGSSVTRRGAQPSLPTRTEVNEFITVHASELQTNGEPPSKIITKTTQAAYPVSVLRPGWQATASGMIRPYLKAHGRTLNDLIADLDAYLALGIDTIEVFAPLQGGVCYHGLDTLDFFTIDPAIGTLDDFTHLIDEAHARQMAVVIFINLGYSHEQFPAFLQACDDVRIGKDSLVSRWFCWSSTGTDRMDRSLTPYFMNDTDGHWQWSERANKFFWVKWEGEKGGFHLPQFNYGDPGWQAEVQRIIRYWLSTGIDGMVIDAVNWYIDCNWEIGRLTLTDPIRAADNQFCQPEGAGGFHDDPVQWVVQGGWNCIMDYKIKLWWENVDVIGDAVRSGNPQPIETALQSYRDRVVAAGGVCYINPPNLETLAVEARLLGAALTATIGELLILIGDQANPEAGEHRRGLSSLLQLRKKYPVLCAGGPRCQLPTSDDTRFYAFLRGSASERVAAVFNFQPQVHSITVDLVGQSIRALKDILSGDVFTCVEDRFSVDLPAYGYRFFSVGEC